MSGIRTVDPASRVVTVSDPLAAWSALARRYGRDQVALLESVAGDSEDAQYTYLGFGRLATLSITGDNVDLQAPLPAREQILARAENGPESGTDEWFWSLIDSFLVQYGGHDQDGVLAFFSYDCGRRIEQIKEVLAPELQPLPEVSLTVFRGSISIPFGSSAGTLTAHDDRLRTSTEELVSEIQDSQLPSPVPSAAEPDTVIDDCDSLRYHRNVESCRRHIAAGDIYQVQLGHTLTVHSKDSPELVYARLRQENPAPYMYLTTVAGHTLIGSSPELLVRSTGGSVTTRPLAGTIPRLAGNERRQRATLLHDPKERAEHTMLVDLCRNDIGRVAKPGSLQVPVDMTVLDFPNVHHLVSTVAGDLAAGTSVTDILKATFPAGTMTGAPKVRAMEIIEAHETTRRGAYAGAVGLIGPGRNINLALCIRALVQRPDGAYTLRASAGIVADSDAEKEWQETLAKLSAPFHALTGRKLDARSHR